MTCSCLKTDHSSLQRYYQWNMGEYSLHLDLNTPSFLFLQHKPSQENNKQMSGMGTASSESCSALRWAGITALVPRLEGRGQASAWLFQSLSRTRKTRQKPPLPVTSSHHLLALHTPFHKSWHINRGTESKTREDYLFCLVHCVFFWLLPWLGSVAVWDGSCSQLGNPGKRWILPGLCAPGLCARSEDKHGLLTTQFHSNSTHLIRTLTNTLYWNIQPLAQLFPQQTHRTTRRLKMAVTCISQRGPALSSTTSSEMRVHSNTQRKVLA